MAQILLIDDDDDVRQTLSSVLTAAGHAVFEAASGVEGLRHISKGCPDLVITDLLMPDKDGFETIIAVRKIHPDVPIVMISGGGRLFQGNSETLADLFTTAKMIGGDYTLAKPFRSAQLLELVEKALAEKRQAAAPGGGQ